MARISDDPSRERKQRRGAFTSDSCGLCRKRRKERFTHFLGDAHCAIERPILNPLSLIFNKRSAPFSLRIKDFKFVRVSMKTLTAIIFLTIIAFIPLIGYAVGVSVSPATLRMETRVGKEAIARFTVWNPSKEVGLFSAYPEEFEEFITLIPSSFVLESGEKREVLVTGKRAGGGLRPPGKGDRGEVVGRSGAWRGGWCPPAAFS